MKHFYKMMPISTSMIFNLYYSNLIGNCIFFFVFL
uniref:Uncharacterized protein n=1 Tax=viral metagenome TaxID=1070528 RepID=A0A6C0EI14_9ZZZZ